jgi:hypothetical protein
MSQNRGCRGNDCIVYAAELAADIGHLPVADQLTVATVLMRILVDLHFKDSNHEIWNRVVDVLRVTPSPGELREQAQTSPTSRSHH